MLDTYLAIVSHPLFFTFIALCAGVCLLLWATNLSTEKVASPSAWLQEHYVRAILIAVGCLFVGALCFYLVEIALNVPLLVNRLTSEINKPDTDTQPENLRNLAYAIGTLIAVLAGSATVFFSSLRVWMNERNTRALEQGLLNEKLTNALSDLHSTRQITLSGDTIWEEDIVRRNAAIDQLEGLALEEPTIIPRVARQLSVYVRELSSDTEELSPPDTLKNAEELRNWQTETLIKRTDAENAVQTLGRLQRAQLRAGRTLEIELQGANMRGFNLAGLSLRQVNLTSADLSGASLVRAELNSSILIGSNFTGANLTGASVADTRQIGVQFDSALLQLSTG